MSLFYMVVCGHSAFINRDQRGVCVSCIHKLKLKSVKQWRPGANCRNKQQSETLSETINQLNETDWLSCTTRLVFSSSFKR